MQYQERGWAGVRRGCVSDYPQLAEMTNAEALEQLWAKMQEHANDPTRFDRNLARLLNGIEQDLGNERSPQT